MKQVSVTRWTEIGAARDGDTSALTTFVLKYRQAIVSYYARLGHGADAEDLAQEVFVRLLHGGVLARADSTKGRFRSLLFGVSRNVLANHLEHRAAKKRGQGKVRPLGDLDVATPERDEVFDREWLGNLLGVVLERLSREHPNYFAAFRGSVLDGRPQAELAASLKIPLGSVKKHVHRGKRKLVSYLQEEVWSYCSLPADYEAELRYLSRFLSPPS